MQMNVITSAVIPVTFNEKILGLMCVSAIVLFIESYASCVKEIGAKKRPCVTITINHV